MNIVERARRFLFDRKSAYARVFPEGNADVEFVLADLAEFCRAGHAAWDKDPRKHALLTGRQEVWLRIQQHLKMSDEQLYLLLDRLRQLKETAQ